VPDKLAVVPAVVATTQQQERPKLLLLKGCGGISRWSVSSFLPAFAVEAFF
jgi:hypothetical protein